MKGRNTGARGFVEAREKKKWASKQDVTSKSSGIRSERLQLD